MKRREAGLPSGPIRDPLVIVSDEVERGFETVRGSVNCRRSEAFGEPITPRPKVTSGQKRDVPPRESLGEVRSHAGNVTRISAAGIEVGLVPIERLGDSRQFSIITMAADATDRAGPVLCLPEIQDVAPVRIIEIVGRPNCFRPITALAIGNPNHPGPCRRISPIT